MYTLSRWSHEEIENLNKLKMSSHIEAAKKSQGP
jgi:hypothetical protein